MARKKGVRVTLLVEDEALERFARSTLAEFGFIRRAVRTVPYPDGKNAKQWVTQKYPGEVRAYRREANHQKVALLVGTDADEQTVRQRRDALDAALQETAAPPREAQERIAQWIPKWHVETWILFLSHEEVDESQNYKHAVKKPDFDAVGKEFVRQFRESQGDPDATALPSLRVAFKETERLNV